jgi:Ca-activated chloride channel family protein
MKTLILALGLALAAAAPAFAQGLVIPTEPDLPPLALMRHRVSVAIENQAAVTTVEQVFLNNTERQLEAQYVFPIPKGAALSRFSMLVNGKDKAGELVEKTQARRIYNQIVSRAQDPGLLEYLGADVFRASIFPILPRSSQTITLRFEQVLAAEGTLVSYAYPVRANSKRGATVQGEFSIEASLKSPAPIVNVYSPSHSVTIQRGGERDARVEYREKQVTLQRDFQLYYSVDTKDVGLNLVCRRPDPKDPGAFLMLLSPQPKLQPSKVVERDVVFVVDCSGSMQGDKIRQARAALKYCLTKLNDGDRVALVRFSSYVDPWKKEFVAARDGRAEALAWADTLLAEGGTDIAGALDAALAYPRSAARPTYVVFMTDGKPTLGSTTDPKKILARVQEGRTEGLRLFTWGVGYDVDTHLLDGMAELAGGVSEYVRPEEDISTKIAAFANKAAQPVLTNLELEVVGGKVQLANVLPRQIPDLYAGSQIVLLGRYTGDGDVAIRLKGRVNGETQTFDYEGKFPAAEARHEFVETLWAKRRIGHLLDQIRLHGESKELVDDVVRLSVQYGIQTPYTSYLILEDGSPVTAAPARQGGAGGRPHADLPGDRLTRGDPALGQKLAELKKEPAPAPAAKPMEEAERRARNELAATLAEKFRSKDGKAGVDVSGYLRGLKEAGKADDRAGAAPFRKAAGTRFFLYRGMWVDERFEAADATTVVKFGSEAYFRLIEARPEIVEALKIADEILFVTAKGKALVVTAEGAERLTDAQVEEFFRSK